MIARKSGLSKRKLLAITVAAVCTVAIFAVCCVNALTSTSVQLAVDLDRQVRDSVVCIPLVWGLLPIAALAAYVIEWNQAKKEKTK